MTAGAGLLLFQAAAADWSQVVAIADALRAPVGLTIFGALFYRLGIIPIAELEWTSIVTNCHIAGTFQTQGGMALMNAGQQTIKGSVLTTATVQPRCAYLTSVGFLRPGVAKHRVPRLIDQAEPAEPICNEILAAIHSQARQMMNVGAAPPPIQVALPEGSDEPDQPASDEQPTAHCPPSAPAAAFPARPARQTLQQIVSPP